MGGDRKLLAPGHNLGHTDFRRSSRSIAGVGEQTSGLDDGAEIRAVSDVVQLGTFGDTHSATIYPELRTGACTGETAATAGGQLARAGSRFS